MLSCPVDISLLELLTECPDDGGEMWILLINMLKGGDERPHGCGGLSRSRRLSASSRLRAKLSVQPCVGIWNLVDRLTCGGLAEGPLVWLSICACVEDDGQD